MPRIAVLVMLALLVGPVLGTVVDVASAQDPPPVPTVRVSERHVLQGENVTILVDGWRTGDTVQVVCAAGTCPDAPVYTTTAAPRLVFPDDFGVEARRVHAPHWNATWDVRLLKGGNSLLKVANASFTSWIVDLWKFPDRQVEPGDRIRIASSGYLFDGPVKITLERTNTTTLRRETVYTFPSLFPQNGTLRASFRFSPDLARVLRCPEDPLERCRDFWIRISGGGKNTEEIHFYVRPARVFTDVLREPTEGEVPAKVNRTRQVQAAVRFTYRGGLDWLTFLDYGFGKPGPRYQVEKIVGDENFRRTIVHNGTSRWSDGDFGWILNWTVPRDQATTDPSGLPVRYRFVVPEQRDPYNNDIVRAELRAFEVVPYVIPLVFDRAPLVVERADKAFWLLNLTYGDGKPFTSAHNVSRLRFCVMPVSDYKSEVGCLNQPLADLRHVSGSRWRFEHKWAVNEERVLRDWLLVPAWNDASPQKDREGNPVSNRPILVYNLTVAQPRIELITQVGDERREGAKPLERGDQVKVTARIRYPDGTPFNRTRNADGNVVAMYVHQRNRNGDTVLVERYDLTNPDNSDVWVGAFTLGRRAEETPAGAWQFKFDIKDKVKEPNRNSTSFTRNVVPASILITTAREPPLTADLGTSVTYRFKLQYRDGTPVTGDQAGLILRVDVRPLRLLGLGSPVESLSPTWDAQRQEWVAEWQVRRHLPLEKYVLAAAGQDLSGNVVRGDVVSRPVQLVTDTLERSVVNQPPARVPRGENVVVVFDGRDGDVGPEGEGRPSVQVQRWDGRTTSWVIERFDVRAADEPGEEHVGIWNTTLETQAGLYRFRLFGKDAQYAFINATSREFLLEAVRVSRTALTNGTNVTKGGTVTGAIVREEGDELVDAYVVQDGRRADLVQTRRRMPDRFEVDWTVPYTFPTGAFTIVIETRDRHHNQAFGEVGPFFVSASPIRSETVTDPVRIVARGGSAEWHFRSFYPSGDKLAGRSGRPDVTVWNATGPVATAEVKLLGPNYVASWSPSKNAGLSDYWFEAGGRDSYGNTFEPLVSDRFRVEPGEFGRVISQLPPPTNPRDVLTGFKVYTDPDDRALEYEVVRLRASSANEALNNFQGQVVARGEVVPSTDGREWIAEWRPGKGDPLGWYRFRIVGNDRYANRVEQYSGAWQLMPSQIAVEFQYQDRRVVPGEVFTAAFRLRYPDKTFVPEDRARVNLQMTRDGVVTPPQPEVAFNNSHWVATWRIPEALEVGKYQLVVFGFDILGNSILRSGTNPVDYKPTNVEKLLGIPDAPWALLVAALVGVAFALRRRGG